MILKTVKNAADLPFKGVELIKVDGSIRGVIVGGKLRVAIGQYSGLDVTVEVPGETAKRHRVSATIEGFGQSTQHFEHSWDADSAASKLEGMGAKVERAEVNVLLGEDGSVVGEAPTAAPARELEDLPF